MNIELSNEKKEIPESFKLTADNFTQQAYEHLCSLIETQAAVGQTSMDITKYNPSSEFVKFLRERGFDVFQSIAFTTISW